MTTLTPSQLAHIRATALAAVDGWSPTSSSFAALAHCAASHPQAVVALCDRVRDLETGGAVAAERDAWRRMAHRCFKQSVAKGAEIATLREGLRALEDERDGMAKALELARARVAELAVAASSAASALFGVEDVHCNRVAESVMTVVKS